MSIAALHADTFFTEITKSGVVWTIKDTSGFPTSTNASGEVSMPFWSSKSRAQKIIDRLPAYRNFRTYDLPLTEFLARWLPGMEADGLVVGLNWSGKLATGFDLSPADVLNRLNYAMK